MNPKSVLLLSGASAVLLAPSAIATQPTEASPDLIPVIESDSQIPEPVVVEVQVAPPEQIVEVIAPVTPIPVVSPSEPFAPDFSIPTSPALPAIAPTLPEYLEERPEPIPVAAEVISTSPEQVEKFDIPPQAAVPEASSTVSPEILPESIEGTESIGPIEELNEPVEKAMSWSENSPRLYGEPEATTDLIERLAQDDLDHLTPSEWINLLLSEEDDRAEENTAENWENLSVSPVVPELSHEAEFSQAEFEEVEQPTLQRNIALDTVPQPPKSDAPQQLAPASVDSASIASASADNGFATSFDSEAETAPRYRLMVGDRLIFKVQPYRFNRISSDNPDSIRKQKLMRLPEASPNSNPNISAGIGFSLQISNQAQLQFAYGAPNADDLESKTVSSVQSETEMLISAQDDSLIEADVLVTAGEPVKANKPIGKNDLVEGFELVQESNSGWAIATSSISTRPSTRTAEATQLATPKTEKTNAADESDKPIYNFDGSFQWQIAPTVILNTWGGLTINPLPLDSPLFSLAYLFYLGFPDPLDQEGGLVFMASQPARFVGGRQESTSYPYLTLHSFPVPLHQVSFGRRRSDRLPLSWKYITQLSHERLHLSQSGFANSRH